LGALRRSAGPRAAGAGAGPAAHRDREAYVYAQQGRRAEAVRILQRLDSLSSSGKYVTSYAIALVDAALGDRPPGH